jgi:hypothetical protein
MPPTRSLLAATLPSRSSRSVDPLCSPSTTGAIVHDIDLTSQLDRRKMLKGIGAFSAVGALAAVSPETAFAGSRHHGRHGRNNQALLDAYWATLNAGMASATGDFSAMADIYAPDGTLTQSNPAGVTTMLQGIDAIIAFYTKAWTKFRGYQWTLDSTRWIRWDVALNYEHAGSPPLSVPGRCAHLFVFCDGRIQTLDWVTYFGGTA